MNKIESSLKNNDKIILHFIDFYNAKYNKIQEEINLHLQEEPKKILKKTHKKWEEKYQELILELENTFDNLMLEYRELEKNSKIEKN